MSSQLHAYIENVFLLLCYTSRLPDRRRGAQGRCSVQVDVLLGVGLLIGLNMVGMKRPPILDRLGTLFLVSKFTVHVCTAKTGLHSFVHYFTKLVRATASSPHSSTHTHYHSRTHTCATLITIIIDNSYLNIIGSRPSTPCFLS